jgi:hypothetical protein
MGLLDRFWELMRNEFATPPTRRAWPDCCAGSSSRAFHQTNGAHMDSLATTSCPLPARNACSDPVRDSAAKADATTRQLQPLQQSRTWATLASLDLEAIKDVYTFWEAEKRVASSLKERVLSEALSLDVEAVAALASERKAGHWLSGPGSDAADRRAIADAYDAIVAAANSCAGTEHRHTMSFESPTTCSGRIRRTSIASIGSTGVSAPNQAALRLDLLKTLTEEVDRAYEQGFLQPLGWSGVGCSTGVPRAWCSSSRPADFYRTVAHILPSRAKTCVHDHQRRLPVRSSQRSPSRSRADTG